MPGPLAAARLAYGAYKLGKAVYNSRNIGNLEPRQIIADAMNPNVPAEEVLARAAARTVTGKLLAKAEEKIAQR